MTTEKGGAGGIDNSGYLVQEEETEIITTLYQKIIEPFIVGLVRVFELSTNGNSTLNSVGANGDNININHHNHNTECDYNHYLCEDLQSGVQHFACNAVNIILGRLR